MWRFKLKISGQSKYKNILSISCQISVNFLLKHASQKGFSSDFGMMRKKDKETQDLHSTLVSESNKID